MANNPLYDGSLRHFLNFKTPNYGRVEITEPINFDAFSFKIKQGNDRFGRDKEIGGDEIDLEFFLVYAIKTSETQVLIDGTHVNHLSHRLDLILEALKENGSETEIEYILSRNGVDFITGLLDIPESTTDEYSYLKCSVIQNTNKALIERKKDIKVNVFSDKDTFGNYILPLSKTKVFLKSKPITQISEWKFGFNEPQTYLSSTAFNYSNLVLTYGIKNTLSFIQGNGNPNDFKYVELTAQATNVSIELTNIDVTVAVGEVALKVIVGTDIDTGDEYFLDTKTDGQSFDSSYSLDISFVGIGQGIWIYFRNQAGLSSGEFSSMDVKISLTATSVNTVIDTVPYFDFLKQGIKSLSGLDFETNDIETGEFKDQYIFNGNLIRQKDNVTLNFVFKDEVNDFKETNSDYQIFDDKVAVFQYPDFYKNIDMGAFLQTPDLDFERIYNDRFKKVSLEYGYKTFEQDRDEENTIDAFHTESQFLFPNKQVDDTLKVEINHIRDPFTIETAKNSATSSTTALTSDEKIFIIDTIPIEEGTTETFNGVVQMQVNEVGQLLLLADGFVWTLLGFQNGDDVEITSGENIGSYAVLQHSDTVLELTPVGTPTFSGKSFITLVYPLTGVSLTNRTNEGFDLIEGIDSPENCSNLKYTIKRNLMRDAWSSYLATICKDISLGSIINTDFKVNGNLKTQFESGEILTEKDDIELVSLAPKILNKLEYKTKVITGFENAKQLIEDVVNVRGFIRIYDTKNRVIKIHPKLLDQLWADGTMEIVGEARNESDVISIFETTGGVNILEIGYNQIIDTSLEWFKIDNGYVQIFDNDLKPLINPTHYTKIMINGNLFTSDIEFYQTLDNL